MKKIFFAITSLMCACTTVTNRKYESNSRARNDSGGKYEEDAELADAIMIPELHQYLQSQIDFHSPTLQMVSLPGIAADIAFLKAALPNGYGGYDAATKAGFSWEKAFSTLEQAAKEMSIGDWRSLLAKTFSSLPDQHLALMYLREDGTVDGWTSITGRKTKRFELDSECEHNSIPRSQKYFRKNSARVERRVVFVGETAPAIDGCRWQTVEIPQSAWPKVPSVVSLSEHTSLINAHDFSSRDSATWALFRTTAAALRSKNAIVVDLRGNSGGDQDSFYKWICELVGRRPQTARFERLTSAWTILNEVNFFTSQIAFKVGDMEWQEHVRKYRTMDLKRLAAVNSDNLSAKNWDIWDRSAEAMPASTTPVFSGQIVVLVDRYCASACELTVKTLRGLPNVVIAGENTYGMALSGENAAKKLPGSGIGFNWGTWIEADLRDGFGGFVEGSGFQPDVWIEPNGVNSNDQILALVKALQ
jgi:hypothetical protein